MFPSGNNNKEMHQDQFGEFLYGYWGLKNKN